MAVLIDTKEYIVLLQSRYMVLQHTYALASDAMRADLTKEMDKIKVKLAKYHTLSENGEFKELTNPANVQQN